MAKISLKSKLNNLIRQRGQISYSELKGLVESTYFGKYYRMSTAERRLRNESPDVEHIYENGAVKFYKWKGQPLVFREAKVIGFDGKVEKIIKIPI